MVIHELSETGWKSLKGLWVVAIKLKIFSLRIFHCSPDHQTFVFFNFWNMFDDSLVELPIVNFGDAGDFNFLYFFVWNVSDAEVILVFGYVDTLLMTPESVFRTFC